jgi:aspartyl/asparaginyl beta-hydroxylase (cupin superfamily)
MKTVNSIQRESEKIWYSYYRSSYYGNAPWFYCTDEFDWVRKFEGSFEVIKAEIERIVNQNEEQFVPYFNKDIISKENTWKTLLFYFWRKRMHKVMDNTPLLEELFNTIPGFVSAAISKLEAGAEIKWHPGDTSGTIRCHFPITVPDTLPNCGFQVAEESRSWEEGKMLMFCDAYQHRAFNLTQEDRIILIIDVVRPELIHKKAGICSNVLSILWMQRLKFLKKSPRIIGQIVRRCCKIFIYLYVPIQRKLKFL